jgi:hypothetical protein
VTLKNISHILFATPLIKLKLGLQTIIANHPDQSLCLANQKQGPADRSYLLHSCVAGAQLCCAFYQSQQTEENFAGAKPFS